MNLPNEEFFKRRKNKEDSNNAIKIVNHGTISYRLGLDILVKAIENASKNINVTLTLIGGGEQKPELIDYCKKQGILNKIVFFKDFIPVEQLQAEIENFDIGVISMRSNPVYERCMLPVKLLEYVYIGIPVITSDLYGIRKYFSDDMVEYVSPDDINELANKIITLSKNSKRKTELINNSFKFFEKYNWNRQEKKYLEIMNDIIDRD
ncbi:MAG: glycosyltransferase [Sphingobacteriaceae bacterium]|nr:glycosyltransferase [Sphingobacteriaceae bacterium]